MKGAADVFFLSYATFRGEGDSVSRDLLSMGHNIVFQGLLAMHGSSFLEFEVTTLDARIIIFASPGDRNLGLCPFGVDIQGNPP